MRSGSDSPRMCPRGMRPFCSKGTSIPWGDEYLKCDAESWARTPPSVQTPLGAIADIYSAWRGDLAYDPSGIRSPVLVVRGEWDSLCTDADARSLLQEMTHAPIKQDIKIREATHLMHLEESRFR